MQTYSKQAPGRSAPVAAGPMRGYCQAVLPAALWRLIQEVALDNSASK
jgi:hypothetical protein